MEPVWVGVLRVMLVVPAARSLKDSRQVVRSLVDRVRHRFDVSVHELDCGEAIQRRVIVVTTGGNDARTIRALLDKVRALAESNPDAIAADVDVDVFRWHPPGKEWMADRADPSPIDDAAEE